MCRALEERVYTSFCLSIWSADAWDSSGTPSASSVYPDFGGCHEAPGGPDGRLPMFILHPDPQGYRQRWWGGGYEQSATCHISWTSNCLQLWVTVWVGFSSRPSLCSRHAELFFPPRVWEQSFPAFVCIAVGLSELTVMMSSHPCAAICMCVWSLLP